MAASSSPAPSGHLHYYQEHGISPVRYGIETLAAHFDRRDSLYRSLGLPPAAFRGVRVLEVAPGSGQNSLYVAACRPQSFDLVEPNPAGRRDIEAAYAGLDCDHTVPALHPVRFEDFEAEAPFDIVLCENWLGSLPTEVALIRKLASLVAPGGALVLTVVPLAGFFPNVMRKLLALRLVDDSLDFDDKTELLTDVFGPHLATIAKMTRSHRDWVHDCMLNPHYLNVALPLETVVDAIGDQMEALATFPRFTADWRWFKGLTGEERGFNALTLTSYRENAHNLVDYRRTFPPRRAEENAPVVAASHTLHQTAIRWQTAAEAGDTGALPAISEEIGASLSKIGDSLGDFDPGLVDAIEELSAVWSKDTLTASSVREMTSFASLFGRETIYVSFTRPHTPTC